MKVVLTPCLVIEMFRATNASLEMGLTWGEQYRAKLAKYLNSNAICEVFLIIMSQKLPNKNDLAIQNKENNKHSEAKIDSYHERLAVKILPKTTQPMQPFQEN